MFLPLFEKTIRLGYYGGLRVIRATCKKFYQIAKASSRAGLGGAQSWLLRPRNFSFYPPRITRQRRY